MQEFALTRASRGLQDSLFRPSGVRPARLILFLAVLFAGLALAIPAARAGAPSPKDFRGGCAANYQVWKKHGGFGAVAASVNGFCGFAWEFSNLAQARDWAIGWCRKDQRARGCQIVQENKALSEIGCWWVSCERDSDEASCDRLIADPALDSMAHAAANNLKGNIHARRGDTAVAVAAYSAALKANRQHGWANMNRAFVYRDTGRLTEAIADAQNALKYYNPREEDYRNKARDLINSAKARLNTIGSADNTSLCNLALSAGKTQLETRDYYRPVVAEVLRRGLTAERCAALVAAVPPAGGLSDKPVANICRTALTPDHAGFVSGAAYQSFVSEARRRNLDPAKCRTILATLPPSRNYAANTDEVICGAALKPDRSGFETQVRFQDYVREAQWRGLDADTCRGKLASPIGGGSFATGSDVHICNMALKPDHSDFESQSRYLLYVSEARRRGLDAAACRVKLAAPAESAANASNDDLKICNAAMRPDKSGFETAAGSQNFVAEARRRNLDETRCLTILGQALSPFSDAAPAAPAHKRLALVIGNSHYLHVAPLSHTDDDAALMAETLSRTGFTVTRVLDADQAAMKKAMVEFGRDLRDGAEASLFYYAGHAVEVDGGNFLIPVDAAITDRSEIAFQAVSLEDFLHTMEGAPSSVNVVVLDACRDNPFVSATRSLSGGLGMVTAPKGTFIAYATSPKMVARDGIGRNSPFTAALAESIVQPGLRIEDVFKQTRARVLDLTGGQQLP